MEWRKISFHNGWLRIDMGNMAINHARFADLDLDEQKQIYASLGIAEYWVVDVKGMRLFAFGLSDKGTYESIQVSNVLTGLSLDLVDRTLERLATETNTAAANWLMQQLQQEARSH